MAISASELVDRVGKQKFRDMVINSPKNSQSGAEKDRGIKARVKYRYCSHAVLLIDNYEPTAGCKQCVPESWTKPKDFKPGFNLGLGHWVESRSDEKKIAKKLGLIERG